MYRQPRCCLRRSRTSKLWFFCGGVLSPAPGYHTWMLALCCVDVQSDFKVFKTVSCYPCWCRLSAGWCWLSAVTPIDAVSCYPCWCCQLLTPVDAVSCYPCWCCQLLPLLMLSAVTPIDADCQLLPLLMLTYPQGKFEEWLFLQLRLGQRKGSLL